MVRCSGEVDSKHIIIIIIIPGHCAQVTATHPAGLLLHVGEVHPVEVRQHLRDLLLVLENCPGCLGQVIQTRVPPDN